MSDGDEYFMNWEREEWLAARDRPLPEHRDHPTDCRCTECARDEIRGDRP